jgi:hypothetical protein
MPQQNITTSPPPAASTKPATFEGACFCGAVGLRIVGEPVEMGYCHCESCRIHSGAPVVSFALFADHQVTITRGAELLGAFNKAGTSARRFCLRCGGSVMTEHPGTCYTDVSATVLRCLPFRPTIHLNYAEAILPMRDGLAKLEDFPASFGGSGRTIQDEGTCTKTA